MKNGIFAVVCILLGFGLAFVWFKTKHIRNENITENTNTIIQRIERAFKIVSAEGYFNEVYTYEQTKTYAYLIPSTKKAILLIDAKVLMGYDMKKLTYTIDEKQKKINLDHMPEATILSIEPTFRYYDLENGLLNKFEPRDLTKLEANAKERIRKNVSKSDLPKVANKQLSFLLSEVIMGSDWKLEIVDTSGPLKFEIIND